jgi:D-glycero-alpha-D-manno-heptose-7-phosphate kinase
MRRTWAGLRPPTRQVTRAIVARAPTRLDFGGGWTDVPPYCDREGGAVCNVAITRYATATAATHEGVARRAGAGAMGAPADPLVSAALRRSGLPGAVATIATDFPSGAGLGGSSACGVALAGALAMLSDEPLEPAELAARSRETEVDELGIVGGFQDHYAAAIGGALLLTFGDCVGVEPLALAERTAADLARRGVLLYTGESRLSANTVAAVLDAYVRGEPATCAALARMKSLAIEMAAAVRAGDLDALGALVGEHWVHQRRLHESITTPRIDAIVDAAARAGALGVKALGASGGGCVIALARDGREDELARALAPFGERLAFGVDEMGFRIVATIDERHDERIDAPGLTDS